MVMITRPTSLPLLLATFFGTTACVIGPGLLDVGEGDDTDGDATSSSDDPDTGVDTGVDTGDGDTGEGETGDSDTGVDTGDGDGDENSGEPCDCGLDQICVVDVQDPLCGDFSVPPWRCIDPPAACGEGDECDPDCVRAACDGLTGKCHVPCSGNIEAEEGDIYCDLWNPCDMLAQDCGVDQKCVVDWDPFLAGPVNTCVPIEGPGQPGDLCTSDDEAHDDCGSDSVCWGFGNCHALCEPDGTCAPGEVCLIANEGVVAVCEQKCDPNGDECPVGESCVPYEDDIHVCTPSGEATQGLDCTQLAQCPGFYACVMDEALLGCESDACCTAYCDITDPDACDGLDGLECVPWFELGGAPMGLENIGACMVPG